MRIRIAQVLALLLVSTTLVVADPPKVDPKVEPPKGEAKANPKADPPKADDDPIATQLLKDKETYIASLDKAREDMLKAFDKHYESVKSNKSLKIEAQLAQLEKIEGEKKLFEESGIFPTAAAMKVAVSEYRTAQKKAETQCKVAFETAAKAYRDKGDVKLAGSTLEEMKEFLAKTPSAGAGGGALLIVCGHCNKVVALNGSTDEGTHVVTADYVKGDQTMLWKVTPASDGFVYIENVKCGLVMSVDGKANAAQVVISKKQTPASDSQLWKLTPVPNQKDAVKVFGKASGKLWAVNARGTDAGTKIVIWPDAAPKVETAHWFGFFPPK
jgi:hypothetical protein